MEDSVTLERLLQVCTEINFNLVRLVEYLQAKDAALEAARAVMRESHELCSSPVSESTPSILAELLQQRH